MPLTPASTTESGERRFAFLSIFKWEHRKGWDLLLRAYMTEFTIDDPVVLYVLTDKFATTSALMEHLYSMLPPRLERSSLPRVVALPKMAQVPRSMRRVWPTVRQVLTLHTPCVALTCVCRRTCRVYTRALMPLCCLVAAKAGHAP